MFGSNRINLAAAVLAACFWTGSSRLGAQEGAGDKANEGEVLPRGPVHEAYAEPMTGNPEQGLVVPKGPPANIEEMPPDQKPDGEVLWIPGYWAWDDDRNDYIWISGIWRESPPGYNWSPGYWREADKGFQWVRGYWSPAPTEQAGDDQTEYLPAPPASLDNGPSAPQPQAESFWVTGNWRWRSNRYVWRPGYWSQMQPDWVWTPAHYVYTPSGYVFIDGYWDYPLDRRGLIYAPVYFSRPVYSRPRFYYTPAVAVNFNIVVGNFFYRPRYSHYYFGDYYETAYIDRGIYPWCGVSSVRVRYQPDFLFSYTSYREVRRDRDWRVNVRNRYDVLVRNVDARPPRTFVQNNIVSNNVVVKNIQNNVTVNNITVNQINQLKQQNNQIVAPVKLVAASNPQLKLKPIEKVQRDQLVQNVKDVRQFTRERSKIETVSAKPSTVNTGVAQTPVRLKRPTPPTGLQSPVAIKTEPTVGVKPGVTRDPKAGLTTGTKLPDRGKPEKSAVTTNPPATKPATGQPIGKSVGKPAIEPTPGRPVTGTGKVRPQPKASDDDKPARPSVRPTVPSKRDDAPSGKSRQIVPDRPRPERTVPPPARESTAPRDRPAGRDSAPRDRGRSTDNPRGKDKKDKD